MQVQHAGADLCVAHRLVGRRPWRVRPDQRRGGRDQQQRTAEGLLAQDVGYPRGLGAQRVSHIKGKGEATKATPVPLSASVSAAADRAAADRANGPLLITGTSCAMRSSRCRLTKALRCVTSKTPPGTPTRGPPAAMTATQQPQPTSTHRLLGALEP